MTQPQTALDRTGSPRIDRIRQEPKLRWATVGSVARVTPGMLRIGFTGEDLADFASPAFDDHVKLLVPTATGAVERRDYTPRRHDPGARTLSIDFALHEAGPATRWALEARPGDRIRVAGPKGSAVIAPEVRRWLLVGDETALPAIGRLVERAEAGAAITAVVAVTGPRERQEFETRADLETLWVHRPPSDAADAGALLAALRGLELRPETFVWIAAEATVARRVRDHVVEGRGHPRGWTKAGGYWVRGRADAHETIA